jgi:acetyl/propionyl-CoA carboxylase alpha subunit
MGLTSVAVYSECDRTAPHVRAADEAFPIGPSAPRESYLRIDRVLAAARRAGADAIHPGYGFLAENPEFARAVGDAGLIFIGPRPEAIELMGSKTAARAAAQTAGVPVVPGTDTPLPAELSDADVAAVATSIGYPLLVKAVAGGGGKGMRTVTDPRDLDSAVRAARSEAGSSFGDASVYFERQLIGPVFDSASTSEGRRGNALGGGGCAVAESHHDRSGCRGPVGQLHVGRHH